jgi:hypothetical protein
METSKGEAVAKAAAIVNTNKQYVKDTAWFYMDYAEQVKIRNNVSDFTYTEYLKPKT